MAKVVCAVVYTIVLCAVIYANDLTLFLVTTLFLQRDFDHTHQLSTLTLFPAISFPICLFVLLSRFTFSVYMLSPNLAPSSPLHLWPYLFQGYTRVAKG